jgi:UDPglucose 6-dehydrogenase
LVLIDKLVAAGCTVKVFDPVAMEECRRRVGDKVLYGKDMYDATVDADALILVTEWKTFRMPSWEVLARSMRNKLVIDGRNIYDAAELAESGFEYCKIG